MARFTPDSKGEKIKVTKKGVTREFTDQATGLKVTHFTPHKPKYEKTSKKKDR